MNPTVYALRNRPPLAACLPPGWTVTDGPASWRPVARHGFVAYAEPLTPEQEAAFELVRVRPRAAIVEATREEIREYLPAYRELYAADPDAAREGILDAAELAVGFADASVAQDPTFILDVLTETQP